MRPTNRTQYDKQSTSTTHHVQNNIKQTQQDIEKRKAMKQWEPIKADTHEQLDYTPAPTRLRNTASNAEADTLANISTDHHPAIITIKSNLGGKEREKEEANTKKCNNTARTIINQTQLS